jgi:hypothetical protein
VEALKTNKEKKLICFEDSSRVFPGLSVPEGWQKYRICSPDESATALDGNTVLVARQPEARVHQLLAENVVFLNLLEEEHSPTLLQCIAYQTPVVVNPTRYVKEYLGCQYPLFYDPLGDHIDVMHLLHEDKLKATKQYMVTHAQLAGQKFIKDIQQSAIYRSLPIPRSQKKRSTDSYHQEYDVTILICTYTRPNNLPDILQRLCQQDYQGLRYLYGITTRKCTSQWTTPTASTVTSSISNWCHAVKTTIAFHDFPSPA